MAATGEARRGPQAKHGMLVPDHHNWHASNPVSLKFLQGIRAFVNFD